MSLVNDEGGQASSLNQVDPGMGAFKPITPPSQEAPKPESRGNVIDIRTRLPIKVGQEAGRVSEGSPTARDVANLRSELIQLHIEKDDLEAKKNRAEKQLANLVQDLIPLKQQGIISISKDNDGSPRAYLATKLPEKNSSSPESQSQVIKRSVLRSGNFTQKPSAMEAASSIKQEEKLPDFDLQKIIRESREETQTSPSPAPIPEPANEPQVEKETSAPAQEKIVDDTSFTPNMEIDGARDVSLEKKVSSPEVKAPAVSEKETGTELSYVETLNLSRPLVRSMSPVEALNFAPPGRKKEEMVGGDQAMKKLQSLQLDRDTEKFAFDIYKSEPSQIAIPFFRIIGMNNTTRNLNDEEALGIYESIKNKDVYKVYFDDKDLTVGKTTFQGIDVDVRHNISALINKLLTTSQKIGGGKLLITPTPPDPKYAGERMAQKKNLFSIDALNEKGEMETRNIQVEEFILALKETIRKILES